MPKSKKTKHRRANSSNFFDRAKTLAKTGNFGDESVLSKDQYAYYLSIYDLMQQQEGDEKELLVANFLNGIAESKDAKKLIKNKLLSRILDEILPYAKVPQVLAFCRILSDDLRACCLDPYASHVLETLMVVSLKLRQKEKKENGKNETEQMPVEKECRKELSSFLNKTGRFIFNNLREFILDTYGSYVFRSLMEICSGVQIEDSIKMSNKSQKNAWDCHDPGQILRIPVKLQELRKNIASRLLMLPDLPGIITYENGSAALQSALVILKETDSDCCSALVDHILQNGFVGILPSYCDMYDETSDLPLVFQSTPALRLLEAVISSATVGQLNAIFAEYFKGHIQSLGKHKVGNFAVQKILKSWQIKGTFHDLFEEVKEALPAILQVQNTGVIHAFVQACRKLETNQGQCWKAVMMLLKCYESPEHQLAAAPCLLWLKDYDEYQRLRAAGKLQSMSYQGALILQEFLQFIKTMKITNSMFAMKLADLHMMACDKYGSHVINAFFESSQISMKTKMRFFEIFKGIYVELACSKHGSRSLEVMWKEASVKVKTAICEELSTEQWRLKGDRHGQIIYNIFMIRMFSMRKDKKDWQERVDSVAKKRKLLDDMLATVKDETG